MKKKKTNTELLTCQTLDTLDVSPMARPSNIVWKDKATRSNIALNGLLSEVTRARTISLSCVCSSSVLDKAETERTEIIQ